MPRDLVKRRAYEKAYRLRHPEQVRKMNKAYRLAHKEKIRAYLAAYYLVNKERLSKHNAAYRLSTITVRRAQNTAYRKGHKEAHNVANAGRRAKQRNAPINNFTHQQWVLLQEVWKHRCAYCDKRAKGHLTQDHITPLSKGGSHTLANIVPACARCNNKKYTGLPPVPIQPLLL